MLFLISVLSLFWLFHFCSHLLGTCLVVFSKRKNKRASAGVPSTEPISILKPLNGLEPGLKTNLRSLFEIDYPNYEILFSINHPFDEARGIVEDLMLTYPGVQTRLVITGTTVGENPRINNLYISYRMAKNDAVLISQNNIRVPRNYLSVLASKFTKEVGLLTGVCTGGRANGIGGWLQLNYMGAYLARWRKIGFFFKRPLMIGNTILFRRDELDKLGGLEALSHQIAENYLAARLFKNAGRQVVLMSEPVTEHLTGFSFLQYWRHHLSLARIHKSYSLTTFFLEPFSGCFFSGLMGGIAFQLLTHETWLVFFLSHLAFSSIQDLYLLKLDGEKVDLTNLAAWWICESLSFPLWLHGLVGKTIHWKTTTLRLGSGGKVVHTKENLKILIEPSLMNEEGIFGVETQEISLSLVRA